MMTMRMTKRPQKSTERTGFDSIAEAQKPDDGDVQKQPRQQSIHAILSVWPRIFACMGGEELRHGLIYGRAVQKITLHRGRGPVHRTARPIEVNRPYL